MPFQDIAGHHHLLELVARAAVRGRLPPSLIFAGRDGVGKRMAAIALAQLVNCTGDFRLKAEATKTQGETADACGVCPSCKRIARGVHADVLLIEPEDGSIKVDQVREAIERSSYRPFEGRRRVVIIDDADELVEPAQHALLKTLEEPPSASIFILVTSRPDVLLPTVRSRCQRLRFGRLNPGDVAQVLIESHEYSEADARVAAALSDGSVGRALEAGSEGFDAARAAAAQLLEEAAPRPGPVRRLQSAKAIIAGVRPDLERSELTRRMHVVSSMLRDLGILLSGVDERSLAHADLQPTLRGLLKSFDGERVLRGFEAVDRALLALERSVNPKTVAAWVAFQI